jgi:hypothetical protein
MKAGGKQKLWLTFIGLQGVLSQKTELIVNTTVTTKILHNRNFYSAMEYQFVTFQGKALL